MKDNYGITTTEHSFWVRIGWMVVDGKRKPWFQTTFTYSDYPTKEDALMAARVWRNDVLEQWNTIAKKLNLQRCVPFRTKRQRNNKTGTTGVHITDYQKFINGSFKHRRVCVGFIRVKKVSYSKSWSCLKYGDGEAIRLARIWRKQKEKFYSEGAEHAQ